MNRSREWGQQLLLHLVLLLTVLLSTGGCGAPPGHPADRAESEGMQEVNGTRLYYKTIGSGPPIFVLHGGPGRSHRYFLPHLEGLADDHQLVFFDQRGTGLSDGKLALKAISVDQFVEDIEALRVAMGFDRITLLGHSWGAIFALFYAFTYPDHLDRLILVNVRPVTNQFVVEHGDTIRERLQRLDTKAQQTLTTICERPTSELSLEQQQECLLLAAQIDFFDPQKAIMMDAVTEENSAKNGSTVRSLITTNFNQKHGAIEPGLATVKVPTLVIHGAYDPIPLASAQYIQRQIAGSQLVVLPESGHFPFVEQPEQFVATVQAFLRSR